MLRCCEFLAMLWPPGRAGGSSVSPKHRHAAHLLELFHGGEEALEALRELPEEALRGGCEALLECRVEDGVALVSLGGPDPTPRPWGTPEEEHRLDAGAVLALSRALDRVEADPAARSLVLFAEGRYFCNGFDLKFFQAYPGAMNAVQAVTELLLARLLAFPLPTVAAVNGHATAAGAMLALALDFRHMDKDRGYVFVPGIDLGLTYSNGMSRLMEAKLPQVLHRDFIVFGKRFTAATLLPHGVVDTAVPHQEVLPRAIEQALSLRPKSKHRGALARIKTTMYHEAVAALRLESCDFQPMGFEAVRSGQDRPSRPKRKMSYKEGVDVLAKAGRQDALLHLERLSRAPCDKSH